MRFTFASFATLATAALAFAQPQARGIKNINPTAEDIQNAANSAALSPSPAEPNTNAKRFAMHLPPLAPKAHRRGSPRAALTHPTRTRGRSAPRAQTSPTPPVSEKCFILATRTDGTNYGYVSALWNDFGEYYAFLPDQTGALLASFSYSSNAPSQLALTADNGPDSAYPYVGAIDGYGSDADNNIGSGRSDYAYLGGTTGWTPGASAVTPEDGSTPKNSFTDRTGIPEGFQTSIWTFDPATRGLYPQWVNSDGSQPTTHVVYAQGIIALTGDTQAFADTYGDADVLLFKCVPPVTSPSK
ncbi:hypothetical protein FRC12_000478 [Ceratobasidium sp. 428]|nr:hypothetical protein FRC12_000478 [Ceratobasidium sp. 428]